MTKTVDPKPLGYWKTKRGLIVYITEMDMGSHPIVDLIGECLSDIVCTRYRWSKDLSDFEDTAPGTQPGAENVAVWWEDGVVEFPSLTFNGQGDLVEYLGMTYSGET